MRQVQDQLVQDLIREAKAGNPYAFEKLVQLQQTYVFSLAIRLLYDKEEAKDIVQECFVRVWRHLHKYDPAVRFTTWLYRITVNLCLDRLRARGRQPLMFSTSGNDERVRRIPEQHSLEQAHTNQELVEIIMGLTAYLPEKQKLVFTLRDLQDLSVDEVAEITGFSRESVKTNLHYARRTIRSLLDRHYDIQRA